MSGDAGPGASPGGGSGEAASDETASGETAAEDDGEAADSALRATRRELDSLRGQVSGLRAALRDSRQRLAEIQEELRRAESRETAGPGAGESEEDRRELRRRLDSARADVERQSAAAQADFSEVESRHWRALARVFVEDSGGEVATATAFAVRRDGLLVTSRHAVLEADGSPAARIGVQFARSEQVWPGELVATHDEADLALLRVRNVRGDVPVVDALGEGVDPPEAGSPVAVLGYSGGEGARPPDESSGRLPRPALSAGLLVERGTGTLRIQGFGAEGGSGSPIFDADGRLVGVLRGGVSGEAEADGGRILVAVPAEIVRGLIATVLERLEG